MKNTIPNFALLTLLLIVSLIFIIGNNITKITIQSQEENTNTSEQPKFFAIQHANSGTIYEINTTGYFLELNEVSDKTILFSDRPERIVKSVKTSDFIGNLSRGVDNYATNPPNAVLVVEEQDGKEDFVIVELFYFVYDVDKNVLKYEITLENYTSFDIPKKLGQLTLVIDEFINSGAWTGT